MFKLTRSFISASLNHRKQKLCLPVFCHTTTAIQEKPLEAKPNLSQDETSKVTTEKESLDNYFLNAKDVPSLFNLVINAENFHAQHAFKALELMASWAETKALTFSDVEKDVNYQKFISVVQQSQTFQNTFQIINTLKNLVKLGVPSSNTLVESFEHQLLWNLKKVSVQSLLHICAFHAEHHDTEWQRKVLEQTQMEIERRWTQIVDPYHFILMYKLTNKFPKALLDKIDDSVIQKSEFMRVDNLANIIIEIGSSKRRPTPVLRALSLYLFKNTGKLTPKKISHVFYALNSLNFCDEALLGKLGSDFLSQIDDVSQSSIIRSLILSMGHMRYRDKTLIDGLANWVAKNIETCESDVIASLIYTMAAVYYTPNNIEEIFTVCLPKLNIGTISEKSNLVRVVWSLTVLEKFSKDQISLLLDPSFIKSFNLSDPACTGTCLKLLNINAAASAFFDSYDGPKLQLYSLDNLLIPNSRKNLASYEIVLKGLRTLFPPPAYLNERVKTDMGFVVDAEVIVNKLFKPLNVIDYSTTFGEKKSVKSLPVGAYRVAIMIWTFKDFTIGSNSLTGQNELAVKLLSKRGYKVVQIPYFDINIDGNFVNIVLYIEKKIKEAKL